MLAAWFAIANPEGWIALLGLVPMYAAVFAAMTGAWCFGGQYLVSHPCRVPG